MKRFLLVIGITIFLFSLSQRTGAQTNQTVANGTATAAANFPGTGCTYNWVNDKPGIGLAASGTGNIASFTAVNTGGTAVTATITATSIPNGSAYITNYSSGTVSVINTATNTVVSTIYLGTYINNYGASVSPDGSLLYVTSTSYDYGSVVIINTATNSFVTAIQVGNSPYGLVVSPNGSQVYVTNQGSNTVSVINTSTNTVVATIPVVSEPEGIAVSPDGSTVYVADVATNTVSVINTLTNTVVANIAVGSQPAGLSVSPDGNQVYVASGTISVINTTTNTVVSTIPVGSNPQGITTSPNGGVVYVANYNSNTVSVINTATNLVVATISVGTNPTGLSVTQDGSLVFVANYSSNTVSVINTATNAVVATIPVSGGPFSLGNFIDSGNSCSSAPVTFTITVNPTSGTIKAGPVSGDISACAGTASASPNIQQFTVSGSNLANNITATAPTGFEVSLSAGSGYGNSVTLTQTGGTVNSTVVYVRSAASAASGNISGSLTLTSTGAGSQNVAVTGVVNALPTVNAVANQTVLNGAATMAINFTGTGSIFNWVNDTPGIGLAANGTGNIAAFSAVNTGTAPVVATVTVTPISAGFAYIPNGLSNTISVINLATNKVVSTIPAGQNPYGVSASPDGSRVYMTNLNGGVSVIGTVSVINTATNAVVATIPVGSEPQGLAVSPDGSNVYVANKASGTVSVINAASNTVVSTIPVDNGPEDIAVSPDGSKVYVATTAGAVAVINTATSTVIATITVPANAITVSTDGSRVYVTNGSAPGIVSVINTATNAVIATIAVDNGADAITISPDGSRVYVSNNFANTVDVINTATNAVVSVIDVDPAPFGISVSPDGSRVYVTTLDINTVDVINTATNEVISSIQVGTEPYAWGNFITGGVSCNGTPVTFTITVNPTVPAITAGTATGNISACAGTASASPNIQQFTVSGSFLTGDISATAPAGFEVSLSAGSGYGNSVTLTQTDGTVSSTVVYVRSAAAASTGNISGNIALTSPGATTQNVAVTGTVIALLSPSISIAASANNICAGTAVTFTATPVNGGSTPVYQWQLNGSNTGTNSATFSSSTLANGDVVTCVMTSNAACAAPAAATSNSITITVNSQVSPSVSIAASANNICAGTAVTFTATPVNGGSTPVYQWQLNGSNTGTNSATFSSSTLANGDVVTCVMTSNAACAAPAAATSNSITITVNSQVSPSVSIAASANNICAGTAVTFTATPVNGGSTPVYQWQLNGSNTGTNSATFSSSTLANGDVVTCVMTSNAACAAPAAATSNSITITVNSQVSPSVSIAASANNICAGTAVTFTATPVNGGSTPVYQWQLNGSNAGTNSATFSSSTLANSDVVTCAITSNAACAAPAAATSNSITMTVNSQVSPSVSIAASANNICAGTAVTFTATPVNGGSTPVYQWQLNGSNAGTNSATFSSSTLANGDVVTCAITSNAACAAPAAATSNSITMTVNSQVSPSVSIAASANNICAGTAVTFTATPVNGGSTPVYQWQLNGSNAGTNSATFSSSTLANGDVVTCVMTSNAACAAPAAATSNSITMSVNSQVSPSVSIAASANNICAGTAVTFTATLINGGSTPVYQWQLNGSNAGTNNATFSSSSLANGDVVTCIMTSNAACAAPAAATSNSITMTVNSLLTPSISIAASANNVCAGAAVTFTATPVNGGSTPVYQWQLNGSNAGTNNATFSSSSLANGDVVTCVMTSNAACAAPAAATSNSITMTVNSLLTPSISIAASANNVCAGAAVTFTATPVNGGSTPVYQWQLNGSNAGTNNATFSSSSLANGDVVTCIMTSNAACAAPAAATSNSITMTVNSQVSPSISIAASANNICAGMPVTFTATSTNGGSTTVYQWLVNGNNAGTDSPTFSSSTLANGDVVSCAMTSNAACAAPAAATSNSITMTVNSQVNSSISIAASANNICAGMPVTFTATSTNGGSTLVYQWQVNGSNAGTNNATFSSSTLANGDVVSCVMTSNAACAVPVNTTSNSITANVNPSPIVNAGGNKTINEGSSAILNATATGTIADITWSPSLGLSNNKILNPVASPSLTTTYTLTVETTDGCFGMDAATVEVLIQNFIIPNSFTPNGDGVNDTWNINYLNSFPNCTVQIFSRWGENVYSSIGYGVPWDGTYKGAVLPMGTYYYIINLKNGVHPLSGFVAIIR